MDKCKCSWMQTQCRIKATKQCSWKRTRNETFLSECFLSQTARSAKFSKATNYASLNSCSSELVKPIAGRQVTDTSLQLQMTSRVLEESSHEKYTLYHASIFNSPLEVFYTPKQLFTFWLCPHVIITDQSAIQEVNLRLV